MLHDEIARLKGKRPPPFPVSHDRMAERLCKGARQQRRLSEREFAAVVEPHLPAVLASARTILQCEHHAWDAVQETLLSLWCESAVPANLRAWLLRTVKYRSLQLQRCCERRRRREERAARPETSDGSSPVQALCVRELRGLIDKALARLPTDARTLLVLREYEEMDYQAIAERMDLPVGTVRSRLNRTRQALRKLLDGLDDAAGP